MWRMYRLWSLLPPERSNSRKATTYLLGEFGLGVEGGVAGVSALTNVKVPLHKDNVKHIWMSPDTP